MNSTVKESFVTLIVCIVISCITIYFLSKNEFYSAYPTVTVSVTVAIALLISKIISSNLMKLRDK